MEGINVNNLTEDVVGGTEQSTKETLTPEQVMGKIGETVNGMEEMDRRTFIKVAGTTMMAAFLAACGVKPSEQSESAIPNTPVVPTERPILGVEQEYAERGYVLVKDPYRLDSSEFIKGEKGYNTAIAEKFPFPKIGETDEKLTLKYGDENFPVVTYLHHTGGKPPVAGEILPLIYKLPKDNKGVEITPYAISVGGVASRNIDSNDGFERYLIPIVTSGTDSGIVPNVVNGEIVNSTNKAFEIVPDGVTQNRHGFLSWALLAKKEKELVVEGVVNNNTTKMYIDYKDIPSEISSLIGE